MVIEATHLSVQAAECFRMRATIHLEHLRHNFAWLQESHPHSKIMPMLKNDAYGLGDAKVAQVLSRAGAAGFSVDSVGEGIRLRESGIVKPIVVLDGDVPENAALAIEYALLPGIGHEDLLAVYQHEAAIKNKVLPIWLLVDVGLHRSGYYQEDFVRFLHQVKEHKNVQVQTVYAHLSCSFKSADTTLQEMNRFNEAVKQTKEILGYPVKTSLFASHGLFYYAKDYMTDFLRPGVMLYGVNQFDASLKAPIQSALSQLQPVVFLEARVLDLLEFKETSGIGYGHWVNVQPNQLIATISFGYGRGISKHAEGGLVLYQGVRCPIVSKPSMNVMQVDVTAVKGMIKRYDWVTLIGKSGDQEITLSEFASIIGQDEYEVLGHIKECVAYC